MSNRRTLFKLSPLVACASMFFAQHAAAHGYLSEPPSRNLLCSSHAGKAQNFNCGQVTWEPQSVEGKQGFPQAGAPDGQIASGGISQFSELNAQSVDRWKINDIKQGAHNFKWVFTAPHKTKDFKYYLTKQGWNPNAKLTRDQFDLTPFCTIDAHGKKADAIGAHNCTIPTDRTGHHVMLATWHVADTSNMWYNVADLNIKSDGGGAQPVEPVEPVKPEWTTVGSIAPTMDLNVGDTVTNRVFKSSGEVPSMKTTVTIDKAEQGERNMWSMLLAKEINRAQSASLLAGIERDGVIEPALGKNDVYAKSGSGVVRTETTIEHKPEVSIDEGFSITSNSEFKIQNGKATAKFFMKFNHQKDTNVAVKVYDASNSLVGSKSLKMQTQGDVSVDIANAKAGAHTAVATSQIDGGTLMQETVTFKLIGEATGGETGGNGGDGAKCHAEWKKGTAYKTNGKVQYKGRVYQARWWTRGEMPGDPATTGPDYSGKVWRDLGTCSK